MRTTCKGYERAKAFTRALRSQLNNRATKVKKIERTKNSRCENTKTKDYYGALGLEPRCLSSVST